MNKTHFKKLKKKVKSILNKEEWEMMKEILEYYYFHYWRPLATQKEGQKYAHNSFRKMHKLLKGVKISDDPDFWQTI